MRGPRTSDRVASPKPSQLKLPSSSIATLCAVGWLRPYGSSIFFGSDSHGKISLSTEQARLTSHMQLTGRQVVPSR